MNSKRMRFGFLVLAVYAVLGVIGVYSQTSTSTLEISVGNIAALATGVEKASSTSGGGGGDSSAEWHSFLPGAFK